MAKQGYASRFHFKSLEGQCFLSIIELNNDSLGPGPGVRGVVDPGFRGNLSHPRIELHLCSLYAYGTGRMNHQLWTGDSTSGCVAG